MRWIMTMVMAFAVMASAACSGSGSAEEPAAAEQSSPAAAPAGRPADDGISPEDRAAYLAYLGKVDPGLVSHEDRALRRGRETCADIERGIEGAELVEKVSLRFTGGNATVDAAKARKVIAAVKRWICE